MFAPEPFSESPVSPANEEDFDTAIEDAEAEYADSQQSYSAREAFAQLREKYGIQ